MFPVIKDTQGMRVENILLIFPNDIEMIEIALVFLAGGTFLATKWIKIANIDVLIETCHSWCLKIT